MRGRTLGRTGLEVSELGFGASPLGAVYGAFAEQDGIDAVRAALDLGVTFFDVSPYYGATTAETVLGKALRGIDRESYLPVPPQPARREDQTFRHATSPREGEHT